MPTPTIDETGKRHGLLTVVARAGSDASGNVLWEARCDCGKTVVARGAALRTGKHHSCGATLCKATLTLTRQQAIKTGETMTTTNPANPLQSLMDHLSKQLDANAKDANDRASKISDLAARYAAACKEDALSVLAARLTDAPPPPRSADDAALVLWEAVQQLPEIQRLSNTNTAPVIPIKSAPTATEADCSRWRSKRRRSDE